MKFLLFLLRKHQSDDLELWSEDNFHQNCSYEKCRLLGLTRETLGKGQRNLCDKPTRWFLYTLNSESRDYTWRCQRCSPCVTFLSGIYVLTRPLTGEWEILGLCLRHWWAGVESFYELQGFLVPWNHTGFTCKVSLKGNSVFVVWALSLLAVMPKCGWYWPPARLGIWECVGRLVTKTTRVGSEMQMSSHAWRSSAQWGLSCLVGRHVLAEGQGQREAKGTVSITAHLWWQKPFPRPPGSRRHRCAVLCETCFASAQTCL